MTRYEQILERFMARAKDARRTQEQTLLAMVAGAAQSKFGQAHGFERIKSIDDYRKAVPLRTPEEFRTLVWEDPRSLTGEEPSALLRTSATTGAPKVIPYTGAFREAVRSAMDVLTAAMFRDYPELPMKPGQTPKGLGLYQATVASG